MTVGIGISEGSERHITVIDLFVVVVFGQS